MTIDNYAYKVLALNTLWGEAVKAGNRDRTQYLDFEFMCAALDLARAVLQCPVEG